MQAPNVLQPPTLRTMFRRQMPLYENKYSLNWHDCCLVEAFNCASGHQVFKTVPQFARRVAENSHAGIKVVSTNYVLNCGFTIDEKSLHLPFFDYGLVRGLTAKVTKSLTKEEIALMLWHPAIFNLLISLNCVSDNILIRIDKSPLWSNNCASSHVVNARFDRL